MRILSAGMLGVAVLVTFVGCGANGTVTGMVTAGGEPVEAGSIVFQPVDVGVKPALGRIGSDGAYDMRTAGDEGLVPGEYRVLYMPPDQREDENGRPLGKPSKWRSYQGPAETVNVESYENEIPVELQKR
ncbi:hypothetical protein [Blastopirellula retiformator]|uniref:hypothetical protein n=1 Tax=Blastopirellula retiformator TaxID=2527970 RepID=UPI0011B67CE3|nr:hypothetical protein [Blastopirellula retiformator]